MAHALDVEALAERYSPMVLRRCRRLLGNDEDAFDVCQEVFVRLLEQRHRLDASAPSSLLYRIATNLCLNRIRDDGRRPTTSDDETLHAIAAASDDEHQSIARLTLERLFGRHVESSRTMAVLHFVDGLTLAEVAAETGMSVSGVRKRLRNLRLTLTEMHHGH